MAAIQRRASVVWEGSGKAGSGRITSQSGALGNAPYGSASRFEGEKGTNPEELIAAAHSGCFSMAVAYGLERAGFTATKLETTATVTLDRVDGNFTITHSALELKGEVPEIDDAAFQRIAQDAERNCPVSKVLKAEISLKATLS